MLHAYLCSSLGELYLGCIEPGVTDVQRHATTKRPAIRAMHVCVSAGQLLSTVVSLGSGALSSQPELLSLDTRVQRQMSRNKASPNKAAARTLQGETRHFQRALHEEAGGPIRQARVTPGS